MAWFFPGNRWQPAIGQSRKGRKEKKEGLNRKSWHFHPNYGQYQKLKSELKPVNKQQNTKTDYGQELLTKKFEIHGKSLVRFLW